MPYKYIVEDFQTEFDYLWVINVLEVFLDETE